jgi:hypothetical protein
MTEENSKPSGDETQAENPEAVSPKIEYTDPVAKLLTLGEPRVGLEHWGIYFDLGIRREHIPALIQMVGDETLIEVEDEDSPEIWASAHAWRALAKLKAKEAVEPLIEELWRAEEGDDWLQNEFPAVIFEIGPSSIPILAAHLDPSHIHSPTVRVALIQGLIGFVPYDEPTRILIGEILRRQLEKYEIHDPLVNAYLAFGLTLTTAPEETGDLVSRAVGAKRLDTEVFNFLMAAMSRLMQEEGFDDEDDDFEDEDDSAPGMFPLLSGADVRTSSVSRKATKAAKAKRKQAAKSRKQNRKKRK